MSNGDRLSRREVIVSGSVIAASLALAASKFVSPTRASTPVVREDVTSFQTDTSKVKRLSDAVGKLQAVSDKDANDHGGWLANAKAHKDFCYIAANDASQIHYCWWFLSWHRAFIVVTERKLREVAQDDSIAFPYWNWSSDRKVPISFLSGPLAKANRAIPKRDVVDGEVDYFKDDPVKKKLGVAALEATYFEAADSTQVRLSFGGIARPNKEDFYGNNRLEGVPHGPIHNYINGDMGDFDTAAIDPIFFSHHGNLDRLWEIWRQDPKRKATEPSSNTDFLDYEFPFKWLDGSTMIIKVSDTLSTSALGYTYDSLDVFRPQLLSNPPVIVAQAAALPPIVHAEVSIPDQVFANLGTQHFELVITGVSAPPKAMNVGVYVQVPGATDPSAAMEIGSFAAVKSGGEVRFPERDLRFDLTAALHKFRVPKLDVSLIPYELGGPGGAEFPSLKYEAIRIEPAPK